jgi:hypothetical protein
MTTLPLWTWIVGTLGLVLALVSSKQDSAGTSPVQRRDKGALQAGRLGLLYCQSLHGSAYDNDLSALRGVL